MNAIANPIEARDEVWIEEMTSIEVRDAIRAGKTTAIIAAGALEENGPYLAAGKHNFRLETIAPAIARRLGNALLAPIVRLSPSGDITPPTGHMQYAATISLRQETYEALLTDMVSSLAQHGFKDIILFGDSGGGEQSGMKAVADKLNAQWKGNPAQVYFITEFYTEEQYECEFLKTELGIVQQEDRCAATRDLYHDSYEYEATVALSDPNRIRVAERRKAGLFSINGVSMEPLEKTLANGLLLVNHRTNITVRAIKRAMEERKARSGS
jgi:creatinine amidohydrolase/Fe(II)-dependent formamide hydrolase-like protein